MERIDIYNSKQITNESHQWILLAVAAFLCKVTVRLLMLVQS